MSCRIAVVGASGRVGSALVDYLAGKHEVVPVTRVNDESPSELAARAVDGVEVVINAAGVAHLTRPTTPDDIDRLHEGNVDLPLALARSALAQGASMIHISSVKASKVPSTTLYARSKQDADERLRSEFAGEFKVGGKSLTVIRPLALLFPPLDAGRIRYLRFLRWWPGALAPPIRLPVLAPEVFLRVVDESLEGMPSSGTSTGWCLREFGHSERGSLRDVRTAMRAWTKER